MSVKRKLMITGLATRTAWLLGPRCAIAQERRFVMGQPLAQLAQKPARRTSLGELVIEPQDQVERARPGTRKGNLGTNTQDRRLAPADQRVERHDVLARQVGHREGPPRKRLD